MAEIILFRPKMFPDAHVLSGRPPLGLLYISAPLLEDGFSVKVIDEETDPAWEQTLQSEVDASTICVGVSSMTGIQIVGALAFSKLVKEKYQLPVVWGGMHATLLPEQTIQNEYVDVLVQGEGERPFIEVVRRLKNERDCAEIPGVWYKDGDRICSTPKGSFVDLESVPMPPYHLIDIDRYIQTRYSYLPGSTRNFELQPDRGCPHRCAFCYNLHANERKWRAMSAAKVIDQIEHVVKTYNVQGINFVSDNFFVHRGRVAEIYQDER